MQRTSSWKEEWPCSPHWGSVHLWKSGLPTLQQLVPGPRIPGSEAGAAPIQLHTQPEAWAHEILVSKGQPSKKESLLCRENWPGSSGTGKNRFGIRRSTKVPLHTPLHVLCVCTCTHSCMYTCVCTYLRILSHLNYKVTSDPTYTWVKDLNRLVIQEEKWMAGSLHLMKNVRQHLLLKERKETPSWQPLWSHFRIAEDMKCDESLEKPEISHTDQVRSAEKQVSHKIMNSGISYTHDGLKFNGASCVFKVTRE